MQPLKVFVSHSWEWGDLYQGIVKSLDQQPLEFEDMSVPQDKAFELFEGEHAREQFSNLLGERLKILDETISGLDEKVSKLHRPIRELEARISALRKAENLDTLLDQAELSDFNNPSKETRRAVDELRAIKRKWEGTDVRPIIEAESQERDRLVSDRLALVDKRNRNEKMKRDVEDYLHGHKTGNQSSRTFSFQSDKFGYAGESSLQHQLYNLSQNLVLALSNRIYSSDIFLALPHPEHRYRDWLVFEHEQAAGHQIFSIGIGHPNAYELPKYIKRQYDDFFEWGDDELFSAICKFAHGRSQARNDARSIGHWALGLIGGVSKK